MAKKNVSNQPTAIRAHNLLIVESFVSEVLISHGRVSTTRTKDFSFPLPKGKNGKELFANNKTFFTLRKEMEEKIGEDNMNCISVRKGKNRVTTVEYLANKISKGWKSKWPLAKWCAKPGLSE